MSEIKLRVETHEPLRLNYEKPKKPKPYPVCKGCGARLTDPESIERGWGRECWNKEVTTIVFLEIPAGNDAIET